MANTYVTGSEILIIDGRNITEFGKDRVIDLDLSNEALTINLGLSKSQLITHNAESKVGTLKVTVPKASRDGIFLLNLANKARNPQGRLPSEYIVKGTYEQTKFRDNERVTFINELETIVFQTMSSSGANSSEEYQDGQTEFTFSVVVNQKVQ